MKIQYTIAGRTYSASMLVPINSQTLMVKCQFRDIIMGRHLKVEGSFEECVFLGCIFKGVDFGGKFKKCRFINCQFDNIHFQPAWFYDCTFKNAQFKTPHRTKTAFFNSGCEFKDVSGLEVHKSSSGDYVIVPTSLGTETTIRKPLSLPLAVTTESLIPSPIPERKMLGPASTTDSSSLPYTRIDVPPNILPPVRHYRSEQPKVEWDKRTQWNNSGYGGYAGAGYPYIPHGGRIARARAQMHMGMGACTWTPYDCDYDGDSGDADVPKSQPIITPRNQPEVYYEVRNGKQYGYGKSAVLECGNIDLIKDLLGEL